jgi:hypothetical protein
MCGMMVVLFVMTPKTENLDSVLFVQDLIHEAVLDVDSAGIGPAQVSH